MYTIHCLHTMYKLNITKYRLCKPQKSWRFEVAQENEEVSQILVVNAQEQLVGCGSLSEYKKGEGGQPLQQGGSKQQSNNRGKLI